MKRLFVIAMTILVWLTLSSFSSAQEVQEGTILDASTIDQLKGKTLDGKPIHSLLFPELEMMIRNEGYVLKLYRHKEVPIDPRLREATLKNKDICKYDPKTRSVVGKWEVGSPFPEISESDQYAGEKLIWNHVLGAPKSNFKYYKKFCFLLLDPNKGIERKQLWTWRQYLYRGRVGEPHTELGGTLHKRGITAATYPRDIAGLGVFAERKFDGSLEENWAYIKSVRRVRRLPSGAWYDPMGGTDMLQDDPEIYNAWPTWYQSHKLLGKRWILAVANAFWPSWFDNKSGPDEFPYIGLTKKPFWSSVNNRWEPREVYITESIPPPEHPYGKKIIYWEKDYVLPYFGLYYDKKGKLWKWVDFHHTPNKCDDGAPAICEPYGFIIDLQRRHGTIFANHETLQLINKSRPNFVTLGSLEELALKGE
jgi:hypothetical protein